MKLDPELARIPLPGQGLDPELARIPLPQMVPSGESRVAALEKEIEESRGLSDEEFDRRIKAAWAKAAPHWRLTPTELAALHRRLKEGQTSPSTLWLGPVAAAFRAAATPLHAVSGAAAELAKAPAESRKTGKKLTLTGLAKTVGRGAVKGVAQETTGSDVVEAARPDLPPLTRAALGMAWNLGMDPANLVIPPLARGAAGLAERIPIRSTGKAIGRYALAEDAATREIEVAHEEVARAVAREARQIARDAGPPAPPGTRPVTSARELTAPRQAAKVMREPRTMGGLAVREQARERLAGVGAVVAERGRVPLSRRGVTYRLPQPGEPVREADVRNLIGTLAERGSISGEALTPDDAEAELLNYAESLGLDSEALQRAAEQVRSLGRAYHPRIVAAGVRPEAELAREERAGGYLRRAYGRHATPEEHVAWLRANGFPNLADRLENAELNRVQVMGTRGRAPVRLWSPRQNLPVGRRKEMQEITDVVARIGYQGRATARILPRMELFQRLAQDPNLSSEDPSPGWLLLSLKDADLSRRMRGQIDALREAGEEEAARQLEGEMYSGGWGALSDKYVHPRLFHSLVPQPMDVSSVRGLLGWIDSLTVRSLAPEGPAPRGILGLYRRGLGAAKSSVTLFSPLSRVFNNLSNMAQMDLAAGVPKPLVPAYYLAGRYHAIRKTPVFFEITRRMPGLARGGGLQEIVESTRLAGEGEGVGRAAGAARRILLDFPGASWQNDEVAAKVGTALWLIRQGHSADEAALLADAAIYNYDDVPRWILQTRQWNPLLPFPTYAYKTMDLFWRTLLYNPRRLNVYNLAFKEIEKLTPRGKREAEAEMLPEWEKSALGIRLPGEDVRGRPRYWRSGRATPWGAFDVLDPSVALGGRNPFGGALAMGPIMEAVRGETEMGTPIYSPVAPTAEKVRKGAGYVAKSLPLVKLVSDVLATKEKPPREPFRAKPRTVGEVLTRTYPLDVTARAYTMQKDLEERKAQLRTWLRQRIREKGQPLNEWDEDDPDRRYLATQTLQLAADELRLGKTMKKLASGEKK